MNNNILKFNVFDIDSNRYEKDKIRLPKRWKKSMKRAVLGSGINGTEMLRLINYLTSSISGIDTDPDEIFRHKRYNLEWYYEDGSPYWHIIEL